jgi:hypothetical protein
MSEKIGVITSDDMGSREEVKQIMESHEINCTSGM